MILPCTFKICHATCYLNGEVPNHCDGHMATLLVQKVDEGTERSQFDNHHHGLCKYYAIETDKVFVIKAMHALHFLNKVFEYAWLVQRVSL